MNVSFIIVNRNTRALLLSCIASIYETLPPFSFEIWVVDNGSTDGSPDAVSQRFPKVHCIVNAENLGFAKANNQALHQTSGDYVVLLNSDTVLTPSAITTITDFMGLHNDVAVCGGQLLNEDGSLQNSIANFPTLATELLNKSLLRRLYPDRYLGKERHFEGPAEVETIIGACMVVSRKAIESVGTLDEAYFFFFEETDWCLRMKRNGWQIMFVPEAKIYHLQGQTAKKCSSAARIEYWKSRYVYFRKHYPGLGIGILRVGLMVKLIMSLLLQLFGAFFSCKVRDRLRLNARLLAWHLAGCPSDWGLTGTVRL